MNKAHNGSAASDQDAGRLVRVGWVLGADDISLPATFGRIVAEVIRVGDRPIDTVRRLAAGVLEWDLRRSTRGQPPTIAERCVPELPSLRGHPVQPQVWVCSGARELAVALAGAMQQHVLWLTVDGEGGTQRARHHRAWASGEKYQDIRLFQVGESGVRRCLARSEFRTVPTSPALGQLRALAAAASLVRRQLSSASTAWLSAPASTDCVPSDPRPPSDTRLLYLSASVVFRTLKARLHGSSRSTDHWQIGIATCTGSTILSDGIGNARKLANSIHWLRSPSHGFDADPMLTEYCGSPLLLFERLDYATNRGSLYAQKLSPGGLPVGRPFEILARPFHLSFPGTLTDPSDPDHIYLLPEQASSGQTVLYRSRAASAPEQLAFAEHAVLLTDVPGIDPVLLLHESRWYLFVTDGSDGNVDNNLCLFSSDRIDGPYLEHPASPVRSGLRGTRMAGPITGSQKGWIRVGQDNRYRYGAAIVFFRVEELSATSYREVEIGTAGPDELAPGALGVHTISTHASLLAVDRLSAVVPRGKSRGTVSSQRAVGQYEQVSMKKVRTERGEEPQVIVHRKRPIRVATNFPGFSVATADVLGDVEQVDIPPNASHRLALALVRGSVPADWVIVRIDAPFLLKLCFWSILRRGAVPAIVSVDILLSRPVGIPQIISALLKKWLLKQVDLFVLYFLDTSGYERHFGIDAERTAYVPFKVNCWADLPPLAALQHAGSYVLTAGRTRRDLRTFVEAMRICGLPAVLLYQSGGVMQANGTDFELADVPPNVKLVEHDGRADTWLEFIRNARVVALPVVEHTISSSGISTYLDAMALNRAVVLTDGPATRGLIRDQALIVPAADADALARAVERLWHDDGERTALAARGRAYAESLEGEDRMLRDIANEVLQRLGASVREGNAGSRSGT